MLALTRHIGQRTTLRNTLTGEEMSVGVERARSGFAVLSFAVPDHVEIIRDELLPEWRGRGVPATNSGPGNGAEEPNGRSGAS